MFRLKFTRTKYFLLAALAAVGLLLTACIGNRNPDLGASGKTYEVAPALREFYRSLGGEDVLGPAISKLVNRAPLECQFTANALLCLNPEQVGTERYLLSPIGNQLGVHEEPSSADDGSSLVINGYQVYSEFIPLFESLSGTQYSGAPLTQVRMNYAQQRVEQFFENVGYYRKFSDPQGTVKLMAYGAAGCGAECDYEAALESMVIDPSQPISDQSLLEGLAKSTETSVFGNPLTQPYLAADGAREQVYENVVLYAESANGPVRLRPLPALVGITAGTPGEKRFGSENGMVFYAVSGNLGFHVPVIFDEFIANHGGSAISGDPVADVVETTPGTFRQCFTNYCLDYTPAAPEAARLLLAPLGSQYMQQSQVQPVEQGSGQVPASAYRLQVTEFLKQIGATGQQTITVIVTNAADGQPVPGMESEISVWLPDRKPYTSTFPLTQADGSATLTLPVLKRVPNGTILIYTVCLMNTGAPESCASGSFLVWDQP